jgi:hypothetical protein
LNLRYSTDHQGVVDHHAKVYQVLKNQFIVKFAEFHAAIPCGIVYHIIAQFQSNVILFHCIHCAYNLVHTELGTIADVTVVQENT